jgi:hypothetical protein
MLACYLRPSRIDGAKHAAAVIKLIMTRLRQAWPNTRFIVRADSGSCRRRLLQWCERSGVGYIVGLARNARLHALVQVAEASLADAYTVSGSKQCLIGEFSYAAKSGRHERRVITRLEYGEQGTNPRFVLTNLQGDPEALYKNLYCQRGEAENRIKEAQLDLFGTRASCSRFIANQFRLLLAALAYTLMQRLRALALQDTELQRASAATIRVRLLKIGAAILRNTRRVRVMMASRSAAIDASLREWPRRSATARAQAVIEPVGERSGMRKHRRRRYRQTERVGRIRLGQAGNHGRLEDR